jgi:hypothetical protein
MPVDIHPPTSGCDYFWCIAQMRFPERKTHPVWFIHQFWTHPPISRPFGPNKTNGQPIHGLQPVYNMFAPLAAEFILRSALTKNHVLAILMYLREISVDNQQTSQSTL